MQTFDLIKGADVRFETITCALMPFKSLNVCYFFSGETFRHCCFPTDRSPNFVNFLAIKTQTDTPGATQECPPPPELPCS